MLAHVTELFTLTCTWFTWSSVFTCLSILGSSACILIITCITSGMSFIKTTNSIDPRTEPWGDPRSDICVTRETFNLCYSLDSITQEHFYPGINFASYFISQKFFHKASMRYFIVKSKYIMSTSYPWSNASVISSRISKSYVIHDFPGMKPCW